MPKHPPRQNSLAGNLKSSSSNTPRKTRHITLLIHALSGGGAERQISSLANQLTRHGYACTLITLDSAEYDRFPIDPAVIRIGLNVMKQSRSLWMAITENRKRIMTVRTAIQRSQPDCVISFCDKMNVVALAACRPLSIPVVISERSDPHHQKLGWYWEACRRWYYPTCATCVVQTKGVADYLRPILGSKKRIEVIPSAIESLHPTISAVDQSLDRSPDLNLRLLYVGRLSKEKGPARLIEAWSVLAAKHPSWKLVIAGEGPLEASLKRRCDDLMLEDRIEFLGWQNNIWDQLHLANALVLPSLYEGFPGAILEAMFAGVPVVATDCSDSIREMIQHESSGLIASNDLESLTKQMDRLLSDHLLREQIARAATEKVKDFLWPNLISDWIQVIEQASNTEPN